VRPRRALPGASPRLQLALFCAGTILFNFPMLIIFDRDTTVLGLPLLPLALFAVWALLIAGLAWGMERGAARDTDAETADPITPPADASDAP